MPQRVFIRADSRISRQTSPRGGLAMKPKRQSKSRSGICVVRYSARALLTALLLVHTASRLYAQEAAFIDTRSGSERELPVTEGSATGGGYIGCGAGCLTQFPLKIELQKLTMLDSSTTPTVEWTVRITNLTDHEIRLPSSLSWSTSEQHNELGQRSVLRMSIATFAQCVNSIGTPTPALWVSTQLYGSSDGLKNVAVLDPGQWATITGYGPACSIPRNSSDAYRVTVNVSQVVWSEAKGRQREDSRTVYSVASEPSR